MNVRPRSITIISWFLIITSALSVVTFAVVYNNPDIVKLMEMNAMPLWLQYTLNVVGVVVSLGCGVLMLKGKSLGRMVYVGWALVSMVVGLLTTPAKLTLVPGLIFMFIVLFFLFRPKANEFFSQHQGGAVSGS